VAPEFGDDQLRQWRDEGYYFPVDVLTAAEADAALADVRRYDEITRRAGGFLRQRWTYPKIHLVATWADRLINHPRLLDLATRVIGPDLMVWSTNLFLRPAGSTAELAWHQDAAYYGWKDFSGRTVRIWLALTETSPANGTMRYAPRACLDGLVRHGFRQDGLAGRLRGEEVLVEVDEATAVDVNLRPGQCALHQPTTVHSSGPSRSTADRVCFAVDYIDPALEPIGAPDSALLVQGEDRYGHYRPEQRPAADFDAAALQQFYRASVLHDRRILTIMRQLRRSSAAPA
jgi:hypothetical protein